MNRLPKVKSKTELCALIEEIGFLPLFRNEMPGFSVMDITKTTGWWSGKDDIDPWQWRTVIAAQGNIAYGKLFGQKAGFISKQWYPIFANFRRDGYDFDTLYESGKAPRKSKLIMDLFENNLTLPSYEMKRMTGFGKTGEKGFEGVLTRLQMQTYLTIHRFEKRINKSGGEYGWPVSVYGTSDSLFGEEYVRREYDIDPSDSGEKIMQQCIKYIDNVSDDEIWKFIK